MNVIRNTLFILPLLSPLICGSRTLRHAEVCAASAADN
ncbi:Uncharacterised protein [Pantoea agglomerans]|uniref:Uncharacterized protein n=1 Tax=Enterobacter agglomerans TaxID=549 RepID=A0A379LU86_ENTAG|nr:Uncharacterised protein [Pantoea agglomerans]